MRDMPRPCQFLSLSSRQETECLKKRLHVYQELKTNDCVRSKINFSVGHQEPLFATGKEKENRMVWAYHALQRSLQNHSLGCFGGWATPWSVEEMLDGQRQRVGPRAS